MPAHLRDIDLSCDENGCKAAAKVKLFNTYNAPIGVFCPRHGDAALAALQRQEEGAE